MPIEIEVKFLAPDQGALEILPRTLESLNFEILSKSFLEIKDVYVDTTKHSLEVSGWALRFRSPGRTGKWTRTFKEISLAENELVKREEREDEVAFIDTQWKGESLRRTFQVQQKRTVFKAICANKKLQVAASYDFVKWKTFKWSECSPPGLSNPAHLIEVELESGRAESLLTMAEDIAKSTGWQKTIQSKFLPSVQKKQ